MKVISSVLKTIFLISLLLTHLPTLAGDATPPLTQSININTADAQTISKTLKGIGLSKARAIIDYREAYGDFHAIEELEAVKGIGKSTIEKNTGLIRIE